MSEDIHKFPSQLAERFQVRMPDGLRDKLREAAETNNRSMNSEIVARLEASFPKGNALSGMSDPNALIETLLREITALREELKR